MSKQRFLQVYSGTLAASAIALIGPLKHGRHEVEYHVGNEPRSTYADAEAVEDFLDGPPSAERAYHRFNNRSSGT